VLAVWCLLAAATAGYGRLALLAMDAESIIEETGDRLILEIWLGLGIIGCYFLLVGLFAPITLMVAVPLAPGAAISSYSIVKQRGLLKPALQWAGYGLVIAALSLHAALTQVDAYDTALYHQQAVSWLSRFGVVPGIAWLHFRLGWSSSWFALGASLNHGILAGRASSLLGGFVTTSAVVHWLTKAKRLASGTMRSPDWYLLLTYPVLLAAAAQWHYDISLGADLPTWIMANLVVWVAYMCLEGKTRPKALWLPFLVASLGCSFKFSLLPLLPAAVLFAALAGRKIGRAPIAVGAVCCLPVVLTMSANIRTSGCPLYPSALACLPTEWSVPFAHDIQADTTNFARRWILSQSTEKEKLGLALLVLGGALVSLVQWRRRRTWFIPWALCAGAGGLIFLLWGAPNPRFGLGYFLIFPGLALMSAAPRLPAGNAARGDAALLVSSIAVACFLLANRSGGEYQFAMNRFLLPSAMADEPGQRVHIFKRDNDHRAVLTIKPAAVGRFEFRMPVSSDQCWDVHEPCTPAIVDPNFRLKDSARGVGAGFVRAR
jgi:hypothetical protein